MHVSEGEALLWVFLYKIFARKLNPLLGYIILILVKIDRIYNFAKGSRELFKEKF